jgi:hypothetical protein
VLGLGILLNPRSSSKGSILYCGILVLLNSINNFACERCFLKILGFKSFIFSVSLSLENCDKVFIPCFLILLI